MLRYSIASIQWPNYDQLSVIAWVGSSFNVAIGQEHHRHEVMHKAQEPASRPIESNNFNREHPNWFLMTHEYAIQQHAK